MTEKALYACDQCYRCKTRCEKELPRCQRCQKQNSICTYSVTGSGSEVFDFTPVASATHGSNSGHYTHRGQRARPLMHRRAVTWSTDISRDRSPVGGQVSSEHEVLVRHGNAMNGQPLEVKPLLGRDEYQLPHPLEPSLLYSDPNDQVAESSVSCDCIRQILDSIRDIYLASLHWDGTRDMIALQRGIASCEPCLECSSMPRDSAIASSLLFLERALMCMKQTSFQQAARHEGPNLVMHCITIVTHLQGLTSLAAANGLQSFESLANLCSDLQDGFTGVWNVIHDL